MAEQVRATKQTVERDVEEVEEHESPDTSEAQAKVDAADDLLDEIDALLDTTEQLVTYRQAGGE